MYARGLRLVNGGGSIGLMGVMADRMLSLGGVAIGVIPMALREMEVAHHGMTELITVPDMHTRKLTMVNLSDAFISLPGGFGTLDETFETLTWLQLRLHHKPIGLLNVGGYFNPLLDMVDHMAAEGFLKADARALLMDYGDVEGLLHKLNNARPYKSEKWEE